MGGPTRKAVMPPLQPNRLACASREIHLGAVLLEPLFL